MLAMVAADGLMERDNNPLARCRRLAHAHPYAVDAAIAVFTYAAVLISPYVQFDRRVAALNLVTVISGAVVAVALVFRRRAPVSVFAVSLIATSLALALGNQHGHPPFLIGTVVAVGTACSRTNRPLSLWLGLTSVFLLGGVALFGVAGPLDAQNLGVAALTVAGFATGEASRNRRAYIAEVEERARRAEQSREEEASRRVAEERLRIARDLHDLVGHHIALISVQAGVAGHVLDAQPEQARKALAQVRTACRSALDELATTISLLRTPDAPIAPTEPTVGLAQLPALTDAFAASGLPVRRLVEGRERPLPAAVDLTAYRIIQESLTNVRKHAGAGAATVRLGYGPAVISILVTDDGVGPSTGTAHLGHGILGMRERATALGGTLRTGAARAGGFEVAATLPAPEAAQA